MRIGAVSYTHLDEVQHHDGADGGQDDVLEAVPCVGTVDLSSLVQNGVHGSDSTDEHDDVLTDVFPDRAGHQHDVVDGLIPEPEGQLIHVEAHPAQQGIQHKAVGEEELEDEAHRDAADEAGKDVYKRQDFPRWAADWQGSCGRCLPVPAERRDR